MTKIISIQQIKPGENQECASCKTKALKNKAYRALTSFGNVILCAPCGNIAKYKLENGFDTIPLTNGSVGKYDL
jgi:hypothetical protein